MHRQFPQRRHLSDAGGKIRRDPRVALRVRAADPLAESILFEQALCERYLQNPVESRNLFEQVLSKFSKGDLADDSLHALIEMSIEAGDLHSATPVAGGACVHIASASTL